MEKALGTKFKIGANSIANLTSIGGLELSADTLETTVLDSDGWRTFIQGLKDAGEVSISGYFSPADTTGQKALKDAFDNGTEMDFAIIFPPAMGADWGFNGIVTGYATGAELEDLISFEGTIKVSGKPTLGLTPSGGLTRLALTGTGGSLSPTFNAGIHSYTFDGVTAGNVKIKATAANHSLALYVDGVFNQNLTSGSDSSAIDLSIGSVKLTIIAREPGKTQKLYEIIVVKVS